jgi:hypothetical protein
MPERSSEDDDDETNQDMSEPNSVEPMQICMNSNGDDTDPQHPPQSTSLLPVVTPHTPISQANAAAALALAQSMPLSPTSSATHLPPLPPQVQPLPPFVQHPAAAGMMMNDWHQQMFQHQQQYLGKIDEQFDFKPYGYDQYYHQQAAAAAQYSNICQPPHNFEY